MESSAICSLLELNKIHRCLTLILFYTYLFTVCIQDPDGFVSEMESMFHELNALDISEHTSEIMAKMMEAIRKYQVNISC